MRKGKLANFKYSKGPGSFQRLLRTDPGPVPGQWGQTTQPKKLAVLQWDGPPWPWKLFGES